MVLDITNTLEEDTGELTIEDNDEARLYISQGRARKMVAVLDVRGTLGLTEEGTEALYKFLGDALADYKKANRVKSLEEQIIALECGTTFEIVGEYGDPVGGWVRVSGGVVSVTGGAHYYVVGDEARDRYPISFLYGKGVKITGKVAN